MKKEDLPKIHLMHPAIGKIAVSIPEQGLVLGRGGGASDLELNWDSRISRRHARVWLIGKEIWLEDLKSRNGCWFGQERIEVPIRLEAGMTVLIGETVVSAPDAETAIAPDTQPSLEALPLPVRRAPIQATTDLPILRTADVSPPPPRTRAHSRVAAPDRIEVKVEEREDLKELWVRDISRGGIFVQTETPPPFGQPIEVRIETRDGTISLQGQVVHVVDAKAAATSGMTPGVGVQFVNLGPEQRKAIQDLIEGIQSIAKKKESAPAEEEAPAEVESAVKLARSFLDRAEHNDLYGAFQIDPLCNESTMRVAIRELRANFVRALTHARATHAARLERALSVLDRIGPLLLDPRRRLEYDFRIGNLRANERIEAARTRNGPSLKELRQILLDVAPDRVERAAALTRKAFSTRSAGDLKGALVAAHEALEQNPFFDELQSTVKAWEELLEKGGEKSRR
jgi:Tfp pilus assembly protein PilZ